MIRTLFLFLEKRATQAWHLGEHQHQRLVRDEPEEDAVDATWNQYRSAGLGDGALSA